MSERAKWKSSRQRHVAPLLPLWVSVSHPTGHVLVQKANRRATEIEQEHTDGVGRPCRVATAEQTGLWTEKVFVSAVNVS